MSRVAALSTASDQLLTPYFLAVIAESDLSTVTKKALRQKLEAQYGTSIEAKRAFVNASIDSCLAEV